MSLPIVLMPEPDVSTRHPRIGYANLGGDPSATVTADSTGAAYAPGNAFDWKPYSYWSPATGGTHSIQIVFPVAQTADYMAIAQHNIGDLGGSIGLQYSTDSGSTWHDAVPAYSPVGREQIWWDFSSAIAATYWRIVVTCATPAVLGIASFGLKYQPYRGQFSGFMPPRLARSITPYASFSDSGLFLGRSILRKTIKGSIAFDLMALQDAYSQWLPFMQAAEKHPFFLAWMLADWPDDVQLVQIDGDWTQPAMSEFGYIATIINYVGLLQS